MLVSLIFAPFAYQCLRLAVLALDGGITLEPFSEYLQLDLEASFCSPQTIRLHHMRAALETSNCANGRS